MRTKRRPSTHFEIQRCTRCDISKYCEHKVVPEVNLPPGHTGIDCIFIGEAPGASEYINKQPFIGPAGQTLRDILEEALPPKCSYIITNSVYCTPFTDDSRANIRQPSLSEIKECSRHLRRIVNLAKPKKFFALGKIAEKAIKQIDDKIEYKYILHPSKIMQSKDFDYQFDKAILTIKEHLECLN